MIPRTLTDEIETRLRQHRQISILVLGTYQDAHTRRVAHATADHAPGQQVWLSSDTIHNHTGDAAQHVEDAEAGDVIGIDLTPQVDTMESNADIFLQYLATRRYKPLVLVFVTDQITPRVRALADVEVTPTISGIVNALHDNPYEDGGDPLRIRLPPVTTAPAIPAPDKTTDSGPPPCQHPDCDQDATPIAYHAYCDRHQQTENDTAP